ncbi:hypothetical protein HMPREF3277_07380 [Neisseria sp. HMSC70E02]|jgi:integrase, catalytic domain protein|nr:hypothetical protein HMPREF3277_07380 [Neisseria sp. HMSC70E02]
MVSLQAKYGMKRLAKVEKTIEEKLKKQTKRHNKSYQVKWYIPIPNDCLYCKIKKQPTKGMPCLPPLTTIPRTVCG